MKQNNEDRPRKEVGNLLKERPLERAFRMRRMLLELRGPGKEDDGEHIRKLVGPNEKK